MEVGNCAASENFCSIEDQLACVHFLNAFQAYVSYNAVSIVFGNKEASLQGLTHSGRRVMAELNADERFEIMTSTMSFGSLETRWSCLASLKDTGHTFSGTYITSGNNFGRRSSCWAEYSECALGNIKMQAVNFSLNFKFLTGHWWDSLSAMIRASERTRIGIARQNVRSN